MLSQHRAVLIKVYNIISSNEFYGPQAIKRASTYYSSYWKYAIPMN